MPAPTICTITGTIRDTGGTAISGAVISVQALKPFIHSADNSLVFNYEVSTTSGDDGTFSLGVIETTTDSVSLALTIKNAAGSASNLVLSTYSITVPNSASATLASLISGQ